MNTDVAAELRAEVARQGMTQAELAARVGVSQSAVSIKLSGRRPLTLRDIERYADALGMPMWRLVRRAESPDQ